MFHIPRHEIALIGEENQTYGYPTLRGQAIIAKEISCLIDDDVTDYIIGIDLGCGDGKVVDHFNKHIKCSTWDGIELSATRVNRSTYKDDNTIIEGNLLDLDYSQYNFLYINNLAFDDILNANIESKIAREFSGHFMTSAQIKDMALRRMTAPIKVFNVPTNWSHAHQFTLYRV